VTLSRPTRRAPNSQGDGLPLQVNGQRLLADASGALIWPQRRAAMVADLHLEKGSAFAARGHLLPPYDTAATLARLEEVLERHRAEAVYCLGDSFHDADAGSRLTAADKARLTRLTRRYRWTWICGNHDPAPPVDWGGRVVEETTLGALAFRHQAVPAASPRRAGEISGHYHPKAAVRWRHKRIAGRCFVSDGRRLVLPAFGAFTGGLNVLEPAIAALFPEPYEVLLIGRTGIYSFPKTALVL